MTFCLVIDLLQIIVVFYFNLQVNYLLIIIKNNYDE